MLNINYIDQYYADYYYTKYYYIDYYYRLLLTTSTIDYYYRLLQVLAFFAVAKIVKLYNINATIFR